MDSSTLEYMHYYLIRLVTYNRLLTKLVCFFHLFQNVCRKIQSEGLARIYPEDREFLLNLKILPNLIFVPEKVVVECFNILIADFPESALEFATHFEDTYIGKRLPIVSRKVPPFPIRIWNNYNKLLMLLRGGTMHLIIVLVVAPQCVKLLKFLQREQSLQETDRVGVW